MDIHVGEVRMTSFDVFKAFDCNNLIYVHYFLAFSSRAAHGKRSFVPQRERDQKTKTAEPNDRWGLFNIVPEKVKLYLLGKLEVTGSLNFQNDLYRLKGSFQGQQQIPYPENAM